MNPDNHVHEYCVRRSGWRAVRGMVWSAAWVCCALVVGGCGKREAVSQPVTKQEKPVSVTAVPSVTPASVRQAETVAVAMALSGGPTNSTQPAAASGRDLPVAAGSAAAFSNAVQAIQEAYESGAFSDAMRKVAALRAGFPAQTAEVEALEMKVRTAKNEAVQLGSAMDMLISGDQKAASMAREELKQGGETARILLRRAARGSDEALSLRAASILAEMHDEKIFSQVVDRVVRNLATPDRGKYLTALGPMIEAAQPGDLAPLWEKVVQEPAFKQRDVVSVLGTVLEKRCGGKSDRFDAFVGTPGLYAQLQAYVKSAIVTTNDVTASSWGVEQAYRWGAFIAGIHGFYYADMDLKQLVFERIDGQLSFEHGTFGYPDKRLENFAIRWAGKFVVTKPGKYRFHVNSDDGHRLWIAGNKLLDCWGSPGDDQAEVSLAAGLHDIVLDYQQGPGGSTLKAWWASSDSAEQLLSKDVLRAVPIVPNKPAP